MGWGEPTRPDDAALVQAVIDAWVVPGPRPDLHRVAQDDLRRHWPTLANALDHLTRRRT